MKFDVILAGVGGHGVVSLGIILASGARSAGLVVEFNEVHGMAQRGGSVEASLRLADEAIHSALVPKGTADMILATEPLEALRHLDSLGPDGVMVSSTDPHKNIDDYPDIEGVLERLRSLPKVLMIDAHETASRAGTAKAANLVMAGAASELMPIDGKSLEEQIRTRFAPKGDRVVEANLVAFRAGRELARCASL